VWVEPKPKPIISWPEESDGFRCAQPILTSLPQINHKATRNHSRCAPVLKFFFKLIQKLEWVLAGSEQKIGTAVLPGYWKCFIEAGHP
jgi:hypothetical protein